MNKLFILATIVMLFAGQTHAKNIQLKKDTRSIFIEEKKDWELGKDLFGMPYIYFSPQENGQRSNISFTDTGAEVELDVKSLASSQKNYAKDKETWAKSVGAKTISFDPYEVVKNSHGHKVHKIGFSYAFEGKNYIEKSYYIECRGRIVFSKSLRLKQNVTHEKDFAELIQSLDCGGV